MLDLDGIFGGSQQPETSQWLFYQSSDVFVAPFDMEIIVHGVGPGASGAIVVNNNTAGQTLLAATGGGAGGYGKKKLKLAKGTQLALSIGAPGAGVSPSAAMTGLPGNNGGDTTVTGPGINIVFGGGKGGKVGLASADVEGGEGGICTGCDFWLPGGRGGRSAAKTFTATGMNIATGGGGVDLGLGPQTRGGDDLATTITGSGHVGRATGGGSPLGPGGDVTSTSSAAATDGGSPGQRFNLAGHGSVMQDKLVLPVFGYLDTFDKTVPAGSTTSSPGGGSLAVHISSGGGGSVGTSGNTVGGNAYNFAGTGAAAFIGTSTARAATQSPSRFGGGSGAASTRWNDVSSSSGFGATSFIAIEILKP